MLSLMKKPAKKAGLSPGTLIHVGEKKIDQIRIRITEYNDSFFEERELAVIEECCECKDASSVTWINIDGLHEVSIIEKLGNQFNIHPLVLEDILHTEQRPKMEVFDDYLFIISKMLSYDDERKTINTEQFSLILGPNYVLTFQENTGDVFDIIRERLRKQKGRIRKEGADYLAYALIDAIVDNYFIVLEKIDEKMEMLEEQLTENPNSETMQTIHHLKRELIFLRKSVWPLREVIGILEREELRLIQAKTTVFLRDVYDHTIQVIDTIETFRDMVSGMLDLYLTTVSNRMNEVMKVLTIIATIFIPLTFIAGIYGMNFEFMPEIKWHWSYPVVWIIMIAIGVLMLIYFRKKKWL
ncbi:MAG: magnesium/cobalt transporter CorA [Deltaproteobacteria bacterium]|nr:magnesium/cobalt transporter CorA [Deltaproteobacteria bacterium]